MPVLNELNYTSDGLVYEVNPFYCRDTITVLSGEKLAIFAVVGTVTASGKDVLLAPAASDGSEIASGILLQAVDASESDATSRKLVRGPALLRDTALVWPDGITANQKDKATLELLALGIKLLEGA